MARAEPSTSGATISVLIICRVRLYRQGLALVLSGCPRVTVVGESGDRHASLDQIATLRPDVVLIDVAMVGALEIVAQIRDRAPSSKIIAFSVDESEPRIVECIEAGAVACVTCDASIETLVEVIDSAMRDELVCSPRVTAALVRRLSTRAAVTKSELDERLTNRERQVLSLVHQGLANKEIAQRLNIAEATVKNHVHSILDKLGVTTRSQAAVRFSSIAV